MEFFKIENLSKYLNGIMKKIIPNYIPDLFLYVS